MNNDMNNNLNGSIGNVNNGGIPNPMNNPNQMNQNIESLDSNIPVQNVAQNPAGTTQTTFFNEPIAPSPNEVPNSPSYNPMNNSSTLGQVNPNAGNDIVGYNAMPNSQVLNNPMPNQQQVPPTFTSPGVIGTNPPPTNEQNVVLKPQKKKSKLPFILLILVLLAGVGFGTFYVLRYTNLLNLNNSKVKIELKDLTFDLGSSIPNLDDVETFANITGTEAKNCNVSIPNFDKSKVGTYEFTVTCGDIKKTGTLNIVDNTELVVDTKTVYKTKGESLVANEFSKNKDELTFEFVDEEEVSALTNSEPGTYTIKLKVTNKNNKETEVEGKLVILEYEIKGFYTCVESGKDVEGSSSTLATGYSFAILNDGKNGYGQIVKNANIFTFSDEKEYDDLKKTYEKDGKLTINNITGDVEFSEDNKIIITSEADNEEILKTYNETILNNYASIKEYFTNNLKYNCTYEKIENE